ncbi:MAG: hypothetical protein A3F83_03760 [Candidatus Glassbacteria bacterium RIFCSPLOWO2_12_FULL_58_11]|uniref:Uncharacterized protein n=1 Tax=Candidatus Glassbacteria bacterium RIFCSPLOWO2_12_FULL_58_11 TaxID=1817867 RepID=A0A1F5YWF9_9BACT|nr:MAG: hypothetical protein A3F83_03760 [Candidatus Glassbacteria bacterium RIFCSPLOWO2_12_FULL_58_11]
MDYNEFEEYVADYVEGFLDSGLRLRMEEKRRQDPACDQLARLHESILAALQQTPELKAPAGLRERNLAAAAAEEALLEEERKSLKEYQLSWLPISAAVSAVIAMLLVVFRDNLSRLGQAALATGKTAYAWWIAQSGELALKSGEKLAAGNQTLDSWLKSENSYVETASALFLNWLKGASAIINYPVELPGIHFALPAFYIITLALLSLIFWLYRDDFLPSGLSAAHRTN